MEQTKQAETECGNIPASETQMGSEMTPPEVTDDKRSVVQQEIDDNAKMHSEFMEIITGVTPPEVTDEMLRAAGYECHRLGVLWRPRGASGYNEWKLRPEIVDEYKARQHPAAPKPTCPQCSAPLNRVRNEGGSLNNDQFDAEKAGDYYCPTCPSNKRGGYENLCYWWEHEVVPAPKPPDCEAGVEAELAEIEARCNAAIEGPWEYGNRAVWNETINGEGNSALCICEFIDDDNTGNFIAHARTDIPKLLQLFATLTAKLAAADAKLFGANERSDAWLAIYDLCNKFEMPHDVAHHTPGEEGTSSLGDVLHFIRALQAERDARAAAEAHLQQVKNSHAITKGNLEASRDSAERIIVEQRDQLAAREQEIVTLRDAITREAEALGEGKTGFDMYQYLYVLSDKAEQLRKEVLSDNKKLVGAITRLKRAALAPAASAEQQAVVKRICGNCEHWMKTRDCPLEAINRPSSGHAACDTFSATAFATSFAEASAEKGAE